jgi:hypothetical protein
LEGQGTHCSGEFGGVSPQGRGRGWRGSREGVSFAASACRRRAVVELRCGRRNVTALAAARLGVFQKGARAGRRSRNCQQPSSSKPIFAPRYRVVSNPPGPARARVPRPRPLLKPSPLPCSRPAPSHLPSSPSAARRPIAHAAALAALAALPSLSLSL